MTISEKIPGIGITMICILRISIAGMNLVLWYLNFRANLTLRLLSDKCAIASFPVIWVGLFFCTIGVERRAGLDTLFPKTVTLAVKPAPTGSILLGKR
ncbi:MAG: hypothetical protein RIC07_28580, partial [Coleofasciculus sp. E1-EBD-02]